jgi:hypothetical protein
MSTPATDVETRLKALETSAESSKLWVWLKANLGHYVTWTGLAYTIVKHYL